MLFGKQLPAGSLGVGRTQTARKFSKAMQRGVLAFICTSCVVVGAQACVTPAGQTTTGQYFDAQFGQLQDVGYRRYKRSYNSRSRGYRSRSYSNRRYSQRSYSRRSYNRNRYSRRGYSRKGYGNRYYNSRSYKSRSY